MRRRHCRMIARHAAIRMRHADDFRYAATMPDMRLLPLMFAMFFAAYATWLYTRTMRYALISALRAYAPRHHYADVRRRAPRCLSQEATMLFARLARTFHG